MASEFYEQLGVERQASSARIRSAYGTAVSRLERRRRALVEQGGDTEQIDLQRVRLDEAWTVLSDPIRRRRYDGMLGWTEDPGPRTVDAVWTAVSDGLVHPAAAVGAKLLRVTSKLAEIGTIPLAPSGAADEPPTLIPHDDDLTSPRATRLGPAPPEVTNVARLVEPEPEVPVEAVRSPEPALRVVDGGASDVLVLPTSGSGRQSTWVEEVPTAPPELRALPPEEVSALIDQHGYSGALLRSVRERLGITLQDVADQTRISIRYLEAMESESRDSLPSSTFVRGYVREFARTVGLEPDPTAAGYLRRFEG